jgi:hypothetical protein
VIAGHQFCAVKARRFVADEPAAFDEFEKLAYHLRVVVGCEVKPVTDGGWQRYRCRIHLLSSFTVCCLQAPSVLTTGGASFFAYPLRIVKKKIAVFRIFLDFAVSFLSVTVVQS